MAGAGVEPPEAVQDENGGRDIRYGNLDPVMCHRECVGVIRA